MTSNVILELQRVVGEEYVFTKPADLLVFEYDGSVDAAVETARPFAVVLPTSAAQVAEIVNIARMADLPIVPRGAGTGLSGGAVAQAGGIVVALTRMNQILEVDLVDRTALVQPGVVNLDLSEFVASDRFFFAPDPSSQRACTIGGNVAENAGGPHCLKYGVTSNHVLGLEVVLPDGSIHWFGGRAIDRAGYDLTGTFVGSEGMLGVVTKALVKLTPIPESIAVLMAAFHDVETASLAVSEVIGAGIVPAALEMMDNLTIQAVEPMYHAGYPLEAGAALLVECDGSALEVQIMADEISAILHANGAFLVRVAGDQYEKDLLWKGRKMAIAAMGRLAPNYYLHDTVVPRTRLPQTLKRVNEVSEAFDLPIANVFHAGDGNLHPLMLFDRHRPGDTERVMDASREILTYCVEVGGALSGEHGIGSEKRGYMTMVYDGADLAAMAGIKNAFDPRSLFNPEKLFPSGYQCGEVRALRAQAMAQKLGIHAF